MKKRSTESNILSGISAEELKAAGISTEGRKACPRRRESRPPEMNLSKRSKEERFVGYGRDVHRGAICTSSASGSG